MSGGAQRAAAEPQRSPEPPRPVARSSARVQRSTLRLSQAHDASEREAEQIARQVVAMPAPAIAPRERVPLLAARAAASAAPPRAAPVAPQDEVSPELTREIKAELGAGQSLSTDTRSFMEPRFKASFGGVRIHTDGKAASIAARLGASAFTFGRDIFFANGRYQPDSPAGMELLAHELTHTIQQRETVQRQVAPAARDNVVVKERSGPKVQRGIVSRALDWIADKANYIPGFRMLTIVIGRNPINMAKVDRSGENILRALIEFIPGGYLIVEALENHGVMQKGGKFIEDQFAALGDLGAALRDALMEFIDSLGWSDIFHLGDLWDRAKRIFTAPVDKAIAFGKNLVTGIATLVKDAIIKPLGRWAANNIPKWNLLVGVFGKNPISDDKESPASALIGAFMELIGQQEVWENIKKGNAVARAWQWFQGAMKGALALVVSIPGRVISTLKSLTIFDIVTLVGAFKKILGAFASFVGDFMGWAGTTVLNLLEIIFSVVAPSVVPYLKKAGSAFSTIIKAPGRFISTLVKAGKQGFNQFKAQFVTYLRDALFKWLLGAEGAGIYFPKSFAPVELLKLGLSVLGLTWANIRNKLVAATNETTVKALETGFDIVVKLVKEGPAAAWEELLKTLSTLKSMVVDAAIDFVKGEVVKIAIEKLVSFLTPAGAFIQAIISIYRTIMFIVNKLAEIGRLVAAFIDSIAALASGVVTAAANKVESVLATGLSLAISFLANFAGLGNIPKKVMEIIKKIRAPVDKALDAVVNWIVAQAKKLGSMILQAGTPTDPKQRVKLAIRDAKIVARTLRGKPITKGLFETALAAIKTRYSLNVLEVFQRDGAWWGRAKINPDDEGQLTEKEKDLAKRIREIADQKIKQLKLKKTTGSGSHEDPIIMPAGTGIVSIAKTMAEVPLKRGQVAHFDVTQGGATELRGVSQKPPFGDAVISGATGEERRIDVGKYKAVVDEIRARFGPNDAASARIIFDVILHGGPIPKSMQQHAGWIGGLKVLAAQEVRRDPIAAITLPANMALVQAGKIDMDRVFLEGGRARAVTGGSPGGMLSHSPPGAQAALRGAREELGIRLPPDTPASRGTAATRAGAIAVDAETVTKFAMLRLKSKNEPPSDEIVQVVEEEIRKIAK